MKNDHSPLILLCGGKSSRMGTLKGLLKFGEQSWLEHQLLEYSAFGKSCVVVLGHEFELYFEKLPFLKKASLKPLIWNGLELRVVINRAPELGPFSSLITGLAQLHEKSGAFILPIDVPAPLQEVWLALEAAGLAQNLKACIPEHQGRHGHPVWLAHDFLQRLRQLPLNSPQGRLDYQLHALPSDQKLYVKFADARTTLNINTPEDFELLKKREAVL